MNALNPAKMQAIVQTCPQHLRNQLADVLEYLAEHGAPGASGVMPEGSVVSFLNRQAPEIRQIVAAIGEAAELPRDRPFAEKMTEGERYQSFGLDPQAFVNLHSAVDGSYVAASLQDRMGTDADRSDDTPCLSGNSYPLRRIFTVTVRAEARIRKRKHHGNAKSNHRAGVSGPCRSV